MSLFSNGGYYHYSVSVVVNGASEEKFVVHFTRQIKASQSVP